MGRPERTSASTPRSARTRSADPEHQRRAAEPLANLVAALIDSTQRGNLDWRAAYARPERFEADLRDGNVEVGSVDGDGASPWELLIFRYSDVEPDHLDLVERVSGRGEPWRNTSLGELHASARRSAHGVHDLVKSMIEDLQEHNA